MKQFGYLVELAREKGADAEVLKWMKITQERYAFFLVLREVKFGMPFEEIKERLLTLQKESSAWPLKFFSKEAYGELRYKILTRIVNHLALLRMACAVYNFWKLPFLLTARK